MFDLMNLDNRGNFVRHDAKSPKLKSNSVRKSPFGQNLFSNKEMESINFSEKDELKKEITLHKLIKLTNERLKNANLIKRDFMTKVELYAMFLKVSEIENIKQRFQAEIYIEATWEDNTIQGDAFDPKKNWIPEIFIENAIGPVQESIKYRVFRKRNKTFVCEMRNVKGVFYETLELYDFPLDIQDITITVTSKRSTEEIEFELSNEKNSTVSVENFRMKHEWKLYSILFTKVRAYTDLFNNCKRPGFSFSGKIARKPGYYLNNAYLLMFFITSLGFMPFSFSVTAPNTRIGSTLMLILSSINFKIAVTTRLPTVSYLTVLDKYGLTALIYLATLCIYHAIIGSPLFSILPTQTLIFIDKICFAAFGGLFVTFHLTYIPYFIYKFLAHKSVEPKKESDNTESSVSAAEMNSSRAVSANSILPLIDEDEIYDEPKFNTSMDSARINEISSQRTSITSQSKMISIKPRNNLKK